MSEMVLGRRRSPPPTHRAGRCVGLVSVVILLTACGGAAVRSPSAGAWPRATVEQPAAVTAEPSSTPRYCAPCHPTVITEMRDVAATADGFVAIGSQTDAALVWTSTDGASWRLAAFPDPEGRTLNAVAVNGATSVIVGSTPDGVAAWSRRGSEDWQPAQLDAEPGAATAVVAGGDGFLAAGYVGPQFGLARAAFWHSTDGRTWERVPDAPALDDGRVRALTSTATGFVAVGHRGSPGSDDLEAVSWTSADGTSWQRSASQPALADSLMQSVIAVEGRVVAVGTKAAGDAAVAWTSTDGLQWRRAADAPALHSNSTYAPHAEMSDLVAIGGRLVAVGWNSSPSNGSAVIWTSPDGVTWTREPDEPSLSGGGMAAGTAEGGLVIAGGSTGWPDTHAATAWRHSWH